MYVVPLKDDETSKQWLPGSNPRRVQHKKETKEQGRRKGLQDGGGRSKASKQKTGQRESNEKYERRSAGNPESAGINID